MTFSWWDRIPLLEFAPGRIHPCQFDLQKVARDLDNEKTWKKLPVFGSVEKKVPSS